MVPLLLPTNPPATKSPNTEPPALTPPMAYELVTVPLFMPAKPPTAALPVSETRFVPFTFPVAWEFRIVEPVSLTPTKPPSCTLPEPLTLPVAKDDVIVPGPEGSQSQLRPFWPTSPPTKLNVP